MKRITPSMIVALIALAVALSGTAAAASGLISGTQIKPGTIAASKLTPNAINFLRGHSGLNGATGPIGPAGPAGPAGTAGPAGGFSTANITTVSSSPTDVTNVVGSNVVSDHVDCPAGTRVIAGGGYVSIAKMAASGPSGNGWTVIVYNDTLITVTGTQAFAICAS